MQVLLIHGHPLDPRVWRAQRTALTDRGEDVLVPALRGYRGGPPAGPVVTLADHADDLAALLDAALLDGPAVVGGVSMGGQIALELYRRRPDLVAALVLSGTTAAAETAESRRARLDQAERLDREGLARHTHRTLPMMVGAGATPEATDLVRDMMIGTPAQGAAASQRGRAERADLRPLLPRIAVPTLVLVGDDDPYVPVPQAALMAARIPGARLRVVEGAGHLPSVERPDETTAALLAFLDEPAVRGAQVTLPSR